MGSKNNNVPLYVKVYNELLEKINNGEFNEKLPPEKALAESLNVSRTTLRQALLVLQEDRIIYKVRGSGTYINKKQGEQIKKGIENFFSIKEMFDEVEDRSFCIEDLKISIEETDKVSAELLEVEDGSILWVISRKYVIDDIICAYAIDFIPKTGNNEDTLAKLNSNEDFKWFVEEYIPKKTAIAETNIVATKSGEFLEKEMELNKSTPLLLFNQVLKDEKINPISLNKIYIDSINFDINLIRKRTN